MVRSFWSKTVRVVIESISLKSVFKAVKRCNALYLTKAFLYRTTGASISFPIFVLKIFYNEL